MPIPALNETGWLPPGIYDCSMAEARLRFGEFQNTDSRPALWKRFVAFFEEAKRSRVIEAILVDGSFVTSKTNPNDIDVVVVLSVDHDLTADLPPDSYNILSQKRVRRRFGLDIVVVKNGTDNFDQAVAFFTQVRQQPGAKKGLLRLTL